mgnify:CR=1 FL=1
MVLFISHISTIYAGCFFPYDMYALLRVKITCQTKPLTQAILFVGFSHLMRKNGVKIPANFLFVIANKPSIMVGKSRD